jgi:hypothetical protein
MRRRARDDEAAAPDHPNQSTVFVDRSSRIQRAAGDL